MKKTYFYQDDQKHLHRLQFVCLLKDTVLSNYIPYKINQRKKVTEHQLNRKGKQMNLLDTVTCYNLRYSQDLECSNILRTNLRLRIFEYTKIFRSFPSNVQKSTKKKKMTILYIFEQLCKLLTHVKFVRDIRYEKLSLFSVNLAVVCLWASKQKTTVIKRAFWKPRVK